MVLSLLVGSIATAACGAGGVAIDEADDDPGADRMSGLHGVTVEVRDCTLRYAVPRGSFGTRWGEWISSSEIRRSIDLSTLDRFNTRAVDAVSLEAGALPPRVILGSPGDATDDWIPVRSLKRARLLAKLVREASMACSRGHLDNMTQPRTR